jgi:Rps23 Pro-64 3,4-dihydroxylase Tpa1-like proline 4-hydroxylase
LFRALRWASIALDPIKDIFEILMLIRPLNREELRQQRLNARPYPFLKIDNFLEPLFAKELAASYPTFDSAEKAGRSFSTVNEQRKVQITDTNLFPGPVARLNNLLASPEFLTDLSYIMGIPKLLADEKLVGGGIHITGPGGRLDVHVDFNYLAERQLHRRVNLLLYLNPIWDAKWGGHIQLWDEDVKNCEQVFTPALNRCVIFETSDKSFHGVTPVTSEAPFPRNSFATYYYTKESPENWKGGIHSTVFKARPTESVRAHVLMPVERLRHRFRRNVGRLKHGIRRLIGA